MKIDELRIQARKLGITVDNRWGVKRLEKEIAAIDVPEPTGSPHSAPVDKVAEMNAYALRIWEGQSSSADLIWRVQRIIEGLKGQGYTDFTQLKLPAKDFEKYIHG